MIDPDAPVFAVPGDMPGRIAEYCRKTGQYVPKTPGETVRVIFDSLALCYRRTIEGVAELCGFRPTAINIVGGGSRDTLLDSITADICGLPVVAGPTEATAVGNIAVQLMAAEKMSAAEARELVRRSFPTSVFEPKSAPSTYDGVYEKFERLVAARSEHSL